LEDRKDFFQGGGKKQDVRWSRWEPGPPQSSVVIFLISPDAPTTLGIKKYMFLRTAGKALHNMAPTLSRLTSLPQKTT
jgi:hypothetical protein